MDDILSKALDAETIERAYENFQAMTVARATAVENRRVCENAFEWALQGAIIGETIKGKNDDERRMRGALAFPEIFADMVKAQQLAAAAETDLTLAKIDIERIKTHLDAAKFALAITESTPMKMLYAMARELAKQMVANEKAAQVAQTEPTVAYQFVVTGEPPAPAPADCSEVEIPF